ncbi:PREDICTED: uncharacterized protein LOC105461739, partial [Wasmannia auropunctata]|uniref:uncharacterized protein LOC105461739 n=1 Tax=Wasmannia auropunctata TaxID=64793 RepID=UPI0005EEA903
MSFGAVLFTYIMKNIFVPPFNNLKSLLTDTTYNIVGLKNTDGAIFILNHNNETIVHARQMNRTTITFTLENMHKIACLSQKKRYAILQNEIMHKVNGDMICHLIKMAAITEAGTSGGIASGIVRNYKYKRTIN